MAKQTKPKSGTKARIEWDLLTRSRGTTREELDRATGWKAWSYINDTKGLAKTLWRHATVGRRRPYETIWIE